MCVYLQHIPWFAAYMIYVHEMPVCMCSAVNTLSLMRNSKPRFLTTVVCVKERERERERERAQ
jgi:hypothetical protein